MDKTDRRDVIHDRSSMEGSVRIYCIFVNHNCLPLLKPASYLANPNVRYLQHGRVCNILDKLIHFHVKLTSTKLLKFKMF